MLAVASSESSVVAAAAYSCLDGPCGPCLDEAASYQDEASSHLLGQAFSSEDYNHTFLDACQ